MSKPTPHKIECCLWNSSEINKHDLIRSLVTVEVIEHDSHFTRKILKCKKCGQLFLYQFNEDVDWIDGEDEQFYKWIPVESLEKARELGEKSVLQLLTLPSIRIDYTKIMKDPHGPYKYDYS